MFPRNRGRILLLTDATPQRTGNEEVDDGSGGGGGTAVLPSVASWRWMDRWTSTSTTDERTERRDERTAATEFAAISLKGNSHLTPKNIFNDSVILKRMKFDLIFRKIALFRNESITVQMNLYFSPLLHVSKPSGPTSPVEVAFTTGFYVKNQKWFGCNFAPSQTLSGHVAGTECALKRQLRE